MNRISLPYTTVSDGLSVFDLDNKYRPRLWIDAAGEISWLREEDNGLLITLLEKFAPGQGAELNQPTYWWTEDERLDIHTTLSALVSASGTTLTMTDARVCVKGSFLVSPVDCELMKVTADPDYSANTVVVERGYNGTPATAKAAGATIISLPYMMAELSDPPKANGKVPGKSVWNAISIVSDVFQVSRLQEESFVTNNWGKVEKAVVDTMLDLRRRVGKALLFNARGTTATANEGQEYISQGAYHYIRDGVLDLGQHNSNLTWPIFNDWAEARFDPDASSQVKELMCGLTLWKAILRIVRDMGRLERTPYFEPALGTMAMTITTDGGYAINVYLDKYGLAVNEGLGGWGFLFDMAHVSGRHYKGMQFQWLQNIQDNRAVMYREDAYLGSFSLIMKHQECHGLIRAPGIPIINR